MSLNWKEINLILEELELPGMRIQKAIQSAYDVLALKLYGRNGAKILLVSISPGACRVHETFYPVPKSNKPLRFAEFLNSRIINSRIEEALQLGSDRIVRLTVRSGSPDDSGVANRFRIFLRLWSNAANVIVTGMDGKILDAMRRLPKKGEVSGGYYAPDIPGNPSAISIQTADPTPLKNPELFSLKPPKEYSIRSFPADLLPGMEPSDASFNQKIDAFYRQEGGALSLETLREEARRKYEGSIDRIKLSLEKLKEKETDFERAERFKEYGDLILSNLSLVKPGAEWLETENPNIVRIKLDPRKGPVSSAEDYYEQYRKARSGIKEVRKEIEEGEKEINKLEATLRILLLETNPLALHKLLVTGGLKESPTRRDDAKRPGLSFRRKDWLIIVGRDASENDALLRRYVKGNDLWLHARDYPGSYVFVKQRPGKTVPLDILLDAGNLAIFYSKGRNSGQGDLFYTQVKYLRRAKNGPKGLVLPTQEKNLHIKVEAARLRELETCKL